MKVTLNGRWVYNGRFYGPGEADIPDAAADVLRSRGAFASPAPDPEPTPDPPRKYELFFASISDEQNEALIEAGYQSNEEVIAASNQELIKVPRIGQASIERIRDEHEFQQGQQDPEPDHDSEDE